MCSSLWDESRVLGKIAAIETPPTLPIMGWDVVIDGLGIGGAADMSVFTCVSSVFISPLPQNNVFEKEERLACKSANMLI